MILFILLAGMVIRCTIHSDVFASYCAISDYKTFGTLASLGLLELVYEMRGVIAVFQRNNEKDSEEKRDEEDEE